MTLADLRRRVGGRPARLVTFFAGSALERDAVAEGVAEIFPGAQTVGVSSVHTIQNEDIADRLSLSLMVFDDKHVADARVELLKGISGGINVDPAFAAFRRHFNDENALDDPERYVGLVVADPTSTADQVVTERLGDRSHTMFVGGSASGVVDSDCFDPLWVAANGRTAMDGAALALLRPACPFQAAKMQSFRDLPGAPDLKATRIDPTTGAVLEFNGRPAYEVFAEAFGVDPATMDDVFVQGHGIGLYAGGDLFVRGGRQYLKESGGIWFFTRVLEGQVFRPLESTDMVADARMRMSGICEAWSRNPTAILEYCCIQRYHILKRQQTSVQPYLSTYGSAAVAGFVTFGEAYLGHMNCSSSYLMFG